MRTTLSILLILSVIALAQAQWGYRPFYRPAYGGYYRPAYGGFYRPYFRYGRAWYGGGYNGGYRGGYYGGYRGGYNGGYRGGYYNAWNRFGREYQVQRNESLPVDSYENNAVHCHFSRNESTFSCRRLFTEVTCPVEFNATYFEPARYEFFGLSRIESMNYSIVEPRFQSWNLFPRSLDNQRWLNRTVRFGDRVEDARLYYGERETYPGFRIVDLDCFSYFSRLFSGASHKLVVDINGNAADRVDLFGDVELF